MGFRFQRRVNLSGGWGLNASKSGGSLSYRGRGGSIGTRGFSIRSGIPGLSFRQSWGKNAGATGLILVFVSLAIAALVLVFQLLVILIPIIWQCIAWLVLTTYDLAVHCVQQFRDWRSHSST